jgi:hypothetical protein
MLVPTSQLRTTAVLALFFTVISWVVPARAQTSVPSAEGCPEETPMCDWNYICPGSHSSMEAGLARGARVQSRRDLDANGDGRMDAVLEVIAGRGEWAGDANHPATILALQTPRGWNFTMLFAKLGHDETGFQLQTVFPLQGGALAVIHDRETFDDHRANAYSLIWFDGSNEQKIVFDGTTGTLDETWTFEPRPEGSVVNTAVRGRTERWRMLTWSSEARLIAGPWRTGRRR